MKLQRSIIALVALIWLCPAVQAVAAPCEPRYPPSQQLATIYDSALLLQKQLETLPDHVQVVLLARAGQDLSRFNLRYSHMGFAVRAGNDSRWRSIHLLNRCASDRSDLYDEGLVNFVGESALRDGILLAIPTMELQQRLYPLLIQSDGLARAVHDPRYSALAYPFATEFQNSNQWILEVIAAAQMGLSADDRSNPELRPLLQSWLKANKYQPSRLHIKLHERIAARAGVANVAVVDHPAGERLSGDYSVVTVKSVIDFLQSQHWLDSQQHVANVTTEGSSP
ncbi:hypothetical protein ABB29_02075 [Pseudoxanthomonas dokdonensis]|uniref:DUF2145 domain-containing protein n=2 Tax=Pseudoxanthomonas dokdonensis TaxID=344882 RepID=A0A0R0CNJ1_9GAMM|nr:hypothetical protein ABB29_02075 [Pseudoxanthomonas dokdonensis]